MLLGAFDARRFLWTFFAKVNASFNYHRSRLLISDGEEGPERLEPETGTDVLGLGLFWHIDFGESPFVEYQY